MKQKKKPALLLANPIHTQTNWIVSQVVSLLNGQQEERGGKLYSRPVRFGTSTTTTKSDCCLDQEQDSVNWMWMPMCTLSATVGQAVKQNSRRPPPWQPAKSTSRKQWPIFLSSLSFFSWFFFLGSCPPASIIFFDSVSPKLLLLLLYNNVVYGSVRQKRKKMKTEQTPVPAVQQQQQLMT